MRQQGCQQDETTHISWPSIRERLHLRIVWLIPLSTSRQGVEVITTNLWMIIRLHHAEESRKRCLLVLQPVHVDTRHVRAPSQLTDLLPGRRSFDVVRTTRNRLTGVQLLP